MPFDLGVTGSGLHTVGSTLAPLSRYLHVFMWDGVLTR